MINYRIERALLSEYFNIIEQQPSGYSHLYRGQSNATWHLIPSLYRTRPNVAGGTLAQGYDHYEWEGIHKFFDEGLLYLPNIKRGPTNDRILAQHFGVRTRMLDWSRDPLVALFFAVEKRNTEVDAAVFMLLPNAQLNPDHIQNSDSYDALAFSPPAIDRRIPAQKSVFTMHPYGPENEPFVPIDLRPNMGNQIGLENQRTIRGFAKITIPREIREYFRHLLLSMGIDRRNLFPGLDGVGAHIADLTSWAE